MVRTSRGNGTVVGVLCGALALSAGSVSGMAAGPLTPKPDPEKGHALAERACIACHVVSETAASPVAADVPSFPAIANKPGQTMEAIAGRIVIPHPPMPAISLSREEIGHIVAYIMTLRTNEPGSR
jgi:mono/diheme cytochrome c family protein